MSKSYAEELLQVYASLGCDITYAYPTLGVAIESDLTRLRCAVEERGIHALCVDLPALGKHLDRCLDEGLWSPPEIPFGGQRRDGVLPIFLGSLLGQIFDDTGHLRENADVQAVLFARQVLYLAKRTELDCSPDDTKRTFASFVRTDRTLPRPERAWGQVNPSSCQLKVTYRGFAQSRLLAERAADLAWDSTQPLNDGPFKRLHRERLRKSQELTRHLLANLDTVSGLLVTSLGYFDPSEWRPNHGPGAISQQAGPLNKYQWYGWTEQLDSVFPCSDFGFHSYLSWVDSFHRDDEHSSPHGEWVHHTKNTRWVNNPEREYDNASRMVAVPKDFTKPRLIAAEPSEHQWCQQLVKNWLYDSTKRSWIQNFVRFDDQSLNQDLCRLGSQNGSLMTVDLSEASDRVTCHVVGNFFRHNLRLLKCLIATRTSKVAVDPFEFFAGEQFSQRKKDSKDYELFNLNKFATMGNACTFPVETMIFLAIAIAACLTARRLRVTKRNIMSLVGEVAVFGDDIVVPVDSRESLFLLLDLLWFKVNEGKTFGNGHFRESCGVDCFRGTSVTPIYWSQPLDRDCAASIASTVDIRNLFYKKWYLNVAQRMASTIPMAMPEVRMDVGIMGLMTREKLRRDGLITRFNGKLQRAEFRGYTVKSEATRSQPHDDSGVHQYFTECPHPTTKWKAGYDQRATHYLVRSWAPLSDLGNTAPQ